MRLKTIGLFISSIILPGLLNAQKGTIPNPEGLTTRWSKQASMTGKEIYPRPQLTRNEWINLNGEWEYSIMDSASKSPNQYAGKITVPFPVESRLSGVAKRVSPDQCLWYKRNFDVPQKKDGRYLLHFGAVDYEAVIFLNGKEIGTHKGGYLAFSMDITNSVKQKDNELVVKVFDPTDAGPNAHGKQTLNPGNIYYTPVTGIWQTVWLEQVPNNYITSIKTSSQIDSSTVSIQLNLNEADKQKDFKVVTNILSGGKIVSSKSALITKGSDQCNLKLQVPNPRLWSPDDPFLYDLKIALYQGKNRIDEVGSYFGMRKVDIQKDERGMDRIFLNNKYTYNLGTLDQGFWPDGLYTAPNDEALAYDIKAIKSMGFNTIRKHIKIEPERWYYYADKLGVLVWQDFVNPPQGLPAGSKELFETETKETIAQLYNHPSIITWVLFNEGWGAYDQSRLTKQVKQYDPTRIVNGHSGEMLFNDNRLRNSPKAPWINSDLVDIHTYPYPINTPSLPDKAKVIGEFGGISVAVNGHEWNDMQGWGYAQANAKGLKNEYRKMVDSLKVLERNGLSASIYTQPFDVEDEENGLITYDREVIKIPLDTIRAINSILLPQSRITKYADFVVANDIDINDNNKKLDDLLASYNSGNKDSALLRRLIIMAKSEEKANLASKVGSTYMDIIKNPFSYSNLKFIRYFISKPEDKGFKLFLSNSELIDKILGEYASADVLKSIIRTHALPPFKYEPDKHYDWDKIQEEATNKYGEIGKEVTIGRRMIEYSGFLGNKPDWDKFGQYYVLYFKKNLVHPEYRINQLSWPIFENINDPKILAFATEVVKYAIDNFDRSPEILDTYANLLHKTQQTQKAIEWESKALEQKRGAKDEKMFAETLQKMKDNKPTWPQN